MKKVKDPNRLRFKDYFGSSAMAVAEAVGACLMSSMFMMYLTDYSGLGKLGAVLGSTVLVFARFFDAVNDPLEGWIMDRAKVGKHGKYRPFLLLSTILMAAGLIGLFSIPVGENPNVVLIGAWVIIFYLLYDIGVAFFALNPMLRTMTLNPDERGKLMIGPRMVSMMMGMIGASLITIIASVNEGVGNMRTSFSIVVTAFVAIGAVVSVIGLAMVKEKHHAQENPEDQVKLTDIFGMLKTNGALRIRLLDMLFSGFIWTFLFATMTYYIKWAYCADLSTGAVDTAKLGSLSMIAAMLMFTPLVLGTLIASPLMKKIGSPIKFHRILIMAQIIPCLALFVLELLGVLRMSPVPFFVCAAVVTVAIGADFIPGETINIECMDYEIYKNGRDRSALCNACNKFLGKAQSAVSTVMVSGILLAIGYEVDSVTDTFLGELSAIPTMLTWFIVVMGLVPGVLGLVAWLILRKYPITDEIRADMDQKLNK